MPPISCTERNGHLNDVLYPRAIYSARSVSCFQAGTAVTKSLLGADDNAREGVMYASVLDLRKWSDLVERAQLLLAL